MKIIRLTAALLSSALFLTACNSEPTQPTSVVNPYPNDAELPMETEGDEYWAKDNLDLQRVGNLLERSESPEEFERYLNQEDGINNLDLNGDGYADYISVEEFDDRDSNSRGLSLFSRYGPDLIQEIASIFLYRDQPNYPGARILLRGNEQIYGDDHYYETNWLDRGLQIASSLFGDHDRYSSPYYHDNYPSWYTPYDIVDVPVYRTRITQLYPEPVFVYTAAPPVYFEKINIKSPYNGRYVDKIHAKLVKPTKQQEEFLKSNPSRSHAAKDDKRGRRNNDLSADDKPGRDDPPRSDRGDERGNPGRDDRGAERGNPNKPAATNPGRSDKPARAENPGDGNPNKGGNPDRGAGNPNKGGGNPNKGGGNPNKGGGKGGGKKP